MVDKLEWVTEARTGRSSVLNYTLAEGGHANYWGQLAQRNCLRQLVNGNSPEGSVPCLGGGVNEPGEPKMTLTNLQW